MPDGWGYVSFVESSAMKLEWEKLIFQIASHRPGEVPASQLPCDFEDSKGVLNNRSSKYSNGTNTSNSWAPNRFPHMGVSKNSDTPKWMVSNGKPY